MPSVILDLTGSRFCPLRGLPGADASACQISTKSGNKRLNCRRRFNEYSPPVILGGRETVDVTALSLGERTTPTFRRHRPITDDANGCFKIGFRYVA